MTTIAYSNGILAADTCMSDGDVKVRFSGKLRRMSDGRVAGFAGSVEPGLALLDWLETMEGPIKIRSDAVALVITPGGAILLCDHRGRLIRVDEEVYSIGSGATLAFGAMLGGASAKKAVQIATERNGESGFGVITLDLKPKK